MTTTIEITKKRGDTKRHTFTISKITGQVIDISTWSNFLLTIDPEKYPVGDTNNVDQLTGILTTDGKDGKISFIPSGTVDPAWYFYDIQAIDGNGEKVTPAEGPYKISQDITKD